ncbi:flavodoxin domain-containing protein [Porcincola intestinalis]|nr:flavodoxin domain-containing protein [Porcincola intestinalis]MDY5579504.1 flavodoxin domain-containing protein [Porcincola intestinalis]
MGKTAVVYWSGTGNTENMAHAVADGARKGGASSVDEVTADQFSAADVEK